MNKRAFTLVEIAISALVLAMVMAGCMYLYQKSNSAFSVTLWKQERTVQAERFWTHFRKNIEEATDELVIPDDQMGLPHPRLQKVKDMPILVHSSPETLKDKDKGNILAWNVSTIDIDFDKGNHSCNSTIFYLEKDGRRIYLKDKKKNKPIAELDDVVRISFDVKSLVKADDTSYESIVNGPASPGSKTVGTLLEISLTMAPLGLSVENINKHSGKEKEVLQNRLVPQNHKFRLNVTADMSTSPNY